MLFARVRNLALQNPGQPIATVQQDFAEYTTSGGVLCRLNLNQATAVGRGAEGFPIILNNPGLAVTSITPASVQRSGTGKISASQNATFPAIWINGAEVNAFRDVRDDDRQGFDESLEVFRGSGSSGQIPYDHSLNIDPGATGSSWTVPSGQSVISKHVRREQSNANGADAITDEMVQFSFVDVLPTEGSFSPMPSGRTGYTFNENDIDLSVLPNLPLPANMPSFEDVIGLDVVGMPFLAGIGGEKRRRYEVQRGNDFSTSGYSATIAYGRSLPLYYLCSDISSANKLALARNAAWHAICLYDTYLAGYTWGYGAGQHHGYHNIGFFGAAMFKDAAMMSAMQALNSNMRSHPYFIQPEDVGRGVAFPGPSGQLLRYRRTFYPSDVGKPWWDEIDRGSQPTARYSMISIPVGIIEAFPVFLLTGGPGGLSGLEAYLDGPDDLTNRRSASLKLYDRVKGFRDLTQTFNKLFDFGRGANFVLNFEQFIQAWRSNIPGYGYTGVPDIYDMYSDSVETFTFSGPDDGQLSGDVAPFDFSGNLPILERRARVSLDERSWITFDDIPAEFTLPMEFTQGTEHYIQVAQRNALGWGDYSPNYPVAAGSTVAHADGPRNVVRTAGTEASSPLTNTIAPQIVVRRFDAWQGPEWDPAPSLLGETQVLLSVGIGYWTGGPAPRYADGDYTFEWQESPDGVSNWTAITTANGYIEDGDTQDFARKAENSTRFLRARVRADNGVEQVDAFSNVVECPAIPAVPAGTIINTEFDWLFPIVYEPELLSFTSNNAIPRHLPTVVPIGQGESSGAFMSDKDGGGFPRSEFYLSRQLQPNTTYQVTGQLAITGDQNSDKGNFGFAINDQSNNDNLYSPPSVDGALVENAEDQHYLENFSGQFTTGSSAVDAYVRVNWSGNTGGSGGGDIYLTRLIIEEA